MSQTSNLGLALTAESESDMLFLEWRTAMNGVGCNSNMEKLDSAIGQINESLSGIEEKTSIWDAKSDFSGSYNDLTDKPIVPAGALMLHGTVGDNNSITFEPLPDGQNPYSAAKAAYVAGQLVRIDATNSAGDWDTILTLSRVGLDELQFFNYEETEIEGEQRIQLVKMLDDSTATYSYIVPLTLATLPKYGGESE